MSNHFLTIDAPVYLAAERLQGHLQLLKDALLGMQVALVQQEAAVKLMESL